MSIHDEAPAVTGASSENFRQCSNSHDSDFDLTDADWRALHDRGPWADRTITLVSASEIMNRPDPDYVVEGVLEDGGFGMIYAAPGVGKIFVVLSLLMAIARGEPWLGRDVIQGPVVYVSAEGVGGLVKRLRAMCDDLGIRRRKVWWTEVPIAPDRSIRFNQVPRVILGVNERGRIMVVKSVAWKSSPGFGQRQHRRRWLAVLAVLVAMVGSAGGVAFAAIPDSGTGVFHGCVNTSTGALRLVDPSQTQACITGENSVTWNQRGINWRGTWSSTFNYSANDAVSFGGSSYLAKLANISVPPTTTTTWSVLASGGKPGNTILSGSGTPSILIGSSGDYFMDSTNHILYGPAIIRCGGIPKLCFTFWGSGTNLTGPPGTNGATGASGQGPVYDTYVDNGGDGLDLGTPIPNGASTRVATQTLPTGGDFQVVAHVDLQHLITGEESTWSCELVAANPGNSAVILDGMSAATTSLIVPLSLQGVVSIAAGGTIGINCDEVLARANDFVTQAHITSTQVQTVSNVPSG